jgi:hypothetical protein
MAAQRSQHKSVASYIVMQAEMFGLGFLPSGWEERLGLKAVTAAPADEMPTLAFVVDEAAEPGDVLTALAELLIDLARRQ